MPSGTSIHVLASGKPGHVVPCVGLARALGLEPVVRPVSRRLLFRALAPWGPSDPADPATAPPFPDIVIASARETVPALRAVKRRSGGNTFAVFLGDPRISHGVFDLIWAPEHDRVTGANVIKTLTAPHPHNDAVLAAAQERPDTRLAGLPGPRIACLIGGPSGQFAFGPDDISTTCGAIEALLANGVSIMATASRRTPDGLTSRMAALAERFPANAFFWDGNGENPYRQMLAAAEGFLVTSDSTNMIGEALAAGKPVQVIRLSGDAGKFAYFYDELIRRGKIRYWDGALQVWQTEPVDATQELAAEVVRRYMAFRGNGS